MVETSCCAWQKSVVSAVIAIRVGNTMNVVPWSITLLSARLCPGCHCQEESRTKLQSIADGRPAVELRAEADALLHEHHRDASLLIEPVGIATGSLTSTHLLRQRGIETGCSEK